MRIDYGPGYRLYMARHGDVIVVLLCGGDKSTQRRDLEVAKVIQALGLKLTVAA
jgi:putative addiction module killer protein